MEPFRSLPYIPSFPKDQKLVTVALENSEYPWHVHSSYCCVLNVFQVMFKQLFQHVTPHLPQGGIVEWHQWQCHTNWDSSYHRMVTVVALCVGYQRLFPTPPMAFRAS